MQCAQCGDYIKDNQRYYGLKGVHDRVVTKEVVWSQVCVPCFNSFEKKFAVQNFAYVRDFDLKLWLVFEKEMGKRRDTKNSAVWEYQITRDFFVSALCNSSPF